MQLRNGADAVAALPVDWDHRLDGELIGISDINNAGIDGAGGHGAGREGIRHRRLQRCLDQRDQMIEEIRQAEIDHGGFQIGHAVLQRTAPVQNLRVEVSADIAGIGIDCCRRSRARDSIAELSGDRERPRPSHA